MSIRGYPSVHFARTQQLIQYCQQHLAIRPVTKNLLIGELIHSKRNSSTIAAYHQTKTDICCRLNYRGYPKWSLNRACNIVDRIERNLLLKEKKKNKRVARTANSSTITFITNFSPVYNQVVGIVKKYLPILESGQNLHKILANGIRFV